MCGISGFWSKKNAHSELALKMVQNLKHRGPDSVGVLNSSDEKLALAHQRLSIIDLTAAGHQPMASYCKQHILTFNGEIYNHDEIRKKLDSEFAQIKWKGYSDTEVLLNSLKYWGVKKTLPKLSGMFAFAYWNEKDKTLFLARDRLGEKPLYFGKHNNTFMFGSELKALKAHPSFSYNIDRDALAQYMSYSYVPAPYSIYQNIFKLKPAHYIVVKNFGENISEQYCYWDLKNIANNALINKVEDEKQVVEDLDKLLRNSVKNQMMSDVPIGAFLSGGYDSSTVVALMQAESIKPIKTFTIGFKEDDFNEAKHAKKIAKHLGTEHAELYLGSQQALDIVDRLPDIYDEPFSDVSQIPTLLVSKLAKRDVTVALSGDGGDELFCGYKRYFLQKKIWNILKRIPISLRPLLAIILKNFPGGLAELLIKSLPKRYQIKNVKDRLPKLAEWVNHKNFESFYLESISHFNTTNQIVLDGRLEKFKSKNLVNTILGLNDQEKMMLIDILTYLPDNILHKLDRASMAASLETRIPLLDHRIVEYALRIPLEIKIKDGQGKWPLRQVLYKYLPKEITERPKQGFSVPIEDWLRGPLKQWASELIDKNRLIKEGFFDAEMITQIWDDHLSGKRRFQSYLWNILVFQQWLNKNH